MMSNILEEGVELLKAWINNFKNISIFLKQLFRITLSPQKFSIYLQALKILISLNPDKNFLLRSNSPMKLSWAINPHL